MCRKYSSNLVLRLVNHYGYIYQKSDKVWMKLLHIHESMTRRLLMGLVVFVMLCFKIIAFVNVTPVLWVWHCPSFHWLHLEILQSGVYWTSLGKQSFFPFSDWRCNTSRCAPPSSSPHCVHQNLSFSCCGKYRIVGDSVLSRVTE